MRQKSEEQKKEKTKKHAGSPGGSGRDEPGPRAEDGKGAGGPVQCDGHIAANAPCAEIRFDRISGPEI